MDAVVVGDPGFSEGGVSGVSSVGGGGPGVSGGGVSGVGSVGGGDPGGSGGGVSGGYVSLGGFVTAVVEMRLGVVGAFVRKHTDG